ncbi:MAG: formate dehydrogenase accessory sulfurtransferase FdhD [Gammaproteobacteria bacterium]
MDKAYRPTLSQQGLSPTHAVNTINQFGEKKVAHIAGESPLTLKVNDREIVTLMTLGTHPEELALGYLRNQRLLENINDIESVNVNWDKELVDVTLTTGKEITDWEEKLSKRTVTSGCGQGTVFSCTLDKLYDTKLAEVSLKQSKIYALLAAITTYNAVYKKAGAVHGCALCSDTSILKFVEDVGRHNAADAISGWMWLEHQTGSDKIFYTTGRLTSEMVMKSAIMGIPVLLSRSGITNMGLELARDLGIVMIARAKGKAFLVYNGDNQIEFDAPPKKPPSP